jgi:hypothetical protein
MEVMGWERTKTIWTVPQGFGGEECAPSRVYYRTPL